MLINHCKSLAHDVIINVVVVFSYTICFGDDIGFGGQRVIGVKGIHAAIRFKEPE